MQTREEHLHFLAKQEALHIGLPAQQAEECAAAFVLFWLLGMREEAQYNDAYIRKSAAYFAQNYRRKEARRKRHEVPFPDGGAEFIPPPPATNLEHSLLMHEFNEVIAKALQHLTEAQRECFVRHHIYDESLEEIATAFQKSTSAIKQILYRARHHLRLTLERMGYNETALREYLIPLEE